MDKTDQLALAMMEYNHGDPKRIQHTTKVHAYASLMGREEGLDAETQFILESAALVHDIGIRASEQKYGYQNGKLQEQEGPAVARELLSRLGGYTAQQTDRICWLIAHHHTYTGVSSADHRILLEADFLVNSFEDNLSTKAIMAFRENVFRSPAAIAMLNDMWALEEG